MATEVSDVADLLSVKFEAAFQTFFKVFHVDVDHPAGGNIGVRPIAVTNSRDGLVRIERRNREIKIVFDRNGFGSPTDH